MRFEKGHKEKTRKHILDVAARRMRKEGAAACGIAGIMSDAGLTNGAFYPHFDSKETLVREVLAETLADQRDRLVQQSQAGAGIEQAIRSYLNAEHVAEWENGCPSAALLPEIMRQSSATREVYEGGLLDYVSVLATYLPEPETAASRQRAMALFGLMVGTLQLARAVSDEALRERILQGGLETALVLANSPA
ncbi:TetR/AcrR family transcriptional regulator [Pseudomonas machongensis]